LNDYTTSFGPAPANAHNGNGFRRASAYDDPHPDRTAKVRLALAAAKAAPGTWQSTFCLAHEDSRPSGSLMIDVRGSLAAKCHSQGCKLEDIKAAFEQRDLLEKPRIVATYRYEYEDGSHSFDVIRFDPKGFKQRRPDGRWSMKGVRLVPFKLRELRMSAAGEWVLINEGEEGTLTAIALGFVATNSPGGAGKFRPEYAHHFAGRRVVWIADNDEPGEKHVRSGARILHGAVTEQKILRLPSLPPGGDIRDWTKAGGTAEQLRALIDAAPFVTEKDFEPKEQERGAQAGPYEVTPNGIIFNKLTPSGESISTLLCNFGARITADIKHDDGIESTRHFEIELTVGGQKRTAAVPAKEFPSFSWLPEKFGSRPTIHAGNGVKDRVRDAVQRLSANTIERTVRTHTGWVLINGIYVYLHGGGTIGGTVDADVELPPQLVAFNIPPATHSEIVAGMRSSLELFGLAPDYIIIPLICCIWRAVLGHSDFGIHLHGHTGLLKSELAALAWQHYGALFVSRGMPSWTSTPNFLQGLSFNCKDALLIIDDLLGADVSFVDKQKQYAAADQIFRGLGNASARGRMNANTTLRATKPARCLILSTGEEEVRGESLRSRVWQIPVTEEDTGRGVMNFERLSTMQRKAAAGEFTAAMRGHLEYLAPQYGTVRDSLRHRVSECRDKARKEIGKCHARTPAMLADLAVGFETFTEAALGYEAISASQADEYKSRVWSALISGATAQARSQASQEPAHRFIELMMAAVSAGKAWLAYLDLPQIAEGDDSRRYKRNYGQSTNGLMVGWIDGDNVYLDPDAAYKAAREMAVDGSGVSISVETLKRRLKDQGLLASTDLDTKRRSVCVRRTIEGRRREVLHFLASTLGAVTPELDAVEFREKF
jgi:hypothetical protein